MDERSAPSRPASPVAVSLADVATHLGVAALDPEHVEVTVTGVSQSSRSVAPGDLYVAVPGARTHGARFGADAVARSTNPPLRRFGFDCPASNAITRMNGRSAT